MKKLILLFFLFSLQSFANCSKYELPLQTHYNNGYSITGINVPDVRLANPNATIEFSQGKIPTYFYADEYIPSANDYIASKYDRETFTNDHVVNKLETLCSQIKVPINFTQPTIEIFNSNSLNGVFREQQTELTIYHSFVFKNNLFTVILPPYWDRTKSYPLLINGFYGLNQNLIEQEGPWFIRAIATNYKQNNKGAIAILWNGGGAGATYTTSSLAYKDLNDFLKLLFEHIKVKTNQVITTGGSRGAYTALNIASRPEITTIKVKYVYAINPFDNTNLMSSLTGTTIMNLMAISDSLSGIYGSWDKRYWITRQGDPDTNLNLPVKLNKLRKNKTQIFLSIGTHDIIVPTVVKFNIFKNYQAARIPVEMEVNYLFGHLADRESRQPNLENAINNIERSNYKFIVKNKITNNVIDNNGNKQKLTGINKYNRPLVLELPRYINDYIPAHIIAVGLPKTTYRLVFNNEQTMFMQLIKTDKNGNYISDIDQNFPYGRSQLVNVQQCKKTCRSLTIVRSVAPMEQRAIIDHDNIDSRELTKRPEEYTIDLLKNKVDSFPIYYKGNETTVNNGIIGFR